MSKPELALTLAALNKITIVTSAEAESFCYHKFEYVVINRY